MFERLEPVNIWLISVINDTKDHFLVKIVVDILRPASAICDILCRIQTTELDQAYMINTMIWARGIRNVASQLRRPFSSSVLLQQLQRVSVRRSPADRKLRLHPAVSAQVLASIPRAAERQRLHPAGIPQVPPTVP